MASAERKRASFTLGRVLIAYLNAWFLTRWPEIPQLKSGNNALLSFARLGPIIDCTSLRTTFPQGLSGLFQESQVCLMIAHAYRFLIISRYLKSRSSFRRHLRDDSTQPKRQSRVR